MPKHNQDLVVKNVQELSSTEIRAELERLIAQYEYSRSRINSDMIDMVYVIVFYFSRIDYLLRMLHLFMEALVDTLLPKNTNSKISSQFSFITSLLVILAVDYFLLSTVHFAAIKVRDYVRYLNTEPADGLIADSSEQNQHAALNKLKLLATNPNAELKNLTIAHKNLTRTVDFILKNENILCNIAAPGLHIFHLSCLAAVFFDSKQLNTTDYLRLSSKISTYSRIAFKKFQEYCSVREQDEIASLNSALIKILIEDFPEITHKDYKYQNGLSYSSLLFKFEKFKQKQILSISNKDYFISYKDVFEAVLYCINLVKSMKVTKLDHNAIITTADMAYQVNYTPSSLKEKFHLFLERKSLNNHLKVDVLPLLSRTTQRLICDWQAVEIKDQEKLPNLMFIADTSDINEHYCNLLCKGLMEIYGTRFRFDQQEIIIDSAESDLSSHLKAKLKEIQITLEIQPVTEEPQSGKVVVTSPLSLPEEVTPEVRKLIKRRNQSTPELPSHPTKFFKPITIRWPNNVTYVHEIERVKSEQDITRIIPLTCGRNNIQRYNRFLIVDRRLEAEINNKQLLNRFMASFWKTVGPVNQQGRKRVIKAYQGCDGKQHISDWEGKIPGTDARVYIRKLERSDTDEDLFTADGWDPHPHQR